MIYILISFFVLIISTALFKRAAGTLSLFKPNMISYIYYYQLLCMSFFAALLVVLKKDQHYVISVVSESSRINGWLAVMYTMIVFPLGLLIAKKIWLGGGCLKQRFDSYVVKPVYMLGLNKRPLKYSVWVFTLLSMLACLYSFYSVGYFPLIKAATTPGEILDVIRISSSRGFSGNVYIKNIFAVSLMPLLSYIWFVYAFHKNNALDKMVFWVSFFFSVSILYLTFAKSPVLWYLLSFAFLMYYLKGELKMKRLFILIAIVIALITVMYSMRGVYFSDFFSFNSGPIGRVILGQAAGTYYMFDVFPVKHEHIGFSSISEFLSGILNLEYSDRAARIAMINFNPKGIEFGTAGVMNSLFVAEAWANFGLLGVLLSPIWVGFIIGTLNIFFLKRNKSPLWVALFVSFSVGGSFTGGFNEYMYNAGYTVLVFLVIAIYSFAKVISYFVKNKGLIRAHNIPSSASTRS